MFEKRGVLNSRKMTRRGAASTNFAGLMFALCVDRSGVTMFAVIGFHCSSSPPKSQPQTQTIIYDFELSVPIFRDMVPFLDIKYDAFLNKLNKYIQFNLNVKV